MRKRKVLFLCTGNTARSQMAEAVLRRIAGDEFDVYSAGSIPGKIHPLTIKVMEEKGYDLSGHRSKPLSEYLGKEHFAYLIVACEEADKNCPALLPGVSKRIFMRFEDPAAFQGDEQARLEKFREVRDQIEERLKAWAEEVL